jgi:hypothetical protein
MLTVGGGWGVWLLLHISANESLTSPSIFAINAHGQAQIYGWVDLPRGCFGSEVSRC